MRACQHCLRVFQGGDRVIEVRVVTSVGSEDIATDRLNSTSAGWVHLKCVVES